MRTREDVADFTLNYYRSTERRRLGEALRCAAALYGGRVATPAAGQDPMEGGLSLYFFARVARLDSRAAAEYEQLLGEFPRGQGHRGALRFVATALWLAGRDRRGAPPEPLPGHFPIDLDVLGRPATSPADLDYLLTEFCATGSRESVQRVIDVLRRPDAIRGKLSTWLAAPAPGLLSRWQRRRRLRRLERAAGVRCDADNGTISTPGDLDCLCVSGPYAQRDQFQRFPMIRAALPFSLDEADVASISLKGVARWSLLSLVASHPVVREVWEAEVHTDTIALEAALSRRPAPHIAHAVPDRNPALPTPTISMRKDDSGNYDEVLVVDVDHVVHINCQPERNFLYGLPGTWQFGGEQGALVSPDNRYVGVMLLSPDDLRTGDGPDSLGRALGATRLHYEATYSSPVVEVTPFEAPRFRRAARITAGWQDPASGDQLHTERILVDIGQDWIAQITALAMTDSDALARHVIDTLGTTPERQFYARFMGDRYSASPESAGLA